MTNAPITVPEVIAVARRAWPRHAACQLTTRRRLDGSWVVEDATCKTVLTLHEDYIRVALEAK